MFGIFLKKWVSVMIERKSESYNLKEKYTYLKANNIRCRMKNVVSATDRGMDMGMGMGSVRDSQSVNLEVYYKDVDKAKQLLNI